METNSERRVEPRVAFRGGAFLYVNHERIPCTLDNVSVSGVALTAPAAVARAQLVRIDFTLDRVTWFDLKAIVSRSELTADGCLLGLHFVGLPAEQRDKIQQYVENGCDAAALASGSFPVVEVFS